MGRHSRRGPAPKGTGASDAAGAAGAPRGASQGAPEGEPRSYDGTPARGVPQVRGGHPEQREVGGGWGELRGGGRAPGVGPAIPRQRPAPPGGPQGRRGPRGPRQDYLDAFSESGGFGESGESGEDDDVFARRRPVGVTSSHASGPYGSAPYGSDPYGSDPYGSDPFASVDDRGPATRTVAPAEDDDAPPVGDPAPVKGAKGRTFTGIAAAAVTTVLAVVVAGQVADTRNEDTVQSQSATGQAREDQDLGSAPGGDASPSPSASPSAVALTYAQKMDAKYPLAAKLKGSGKFDAIPGVAKAPGKGRKYTYRVDVEQGLGLDGELFAQAVQKTLNDDRSWAHNGARTFERIYSGRPDFVITLASPGTTAFWCAKSGLDTTEDNVSCDSAATERVMINAYRWAQGSKTYGDEMYAYRQMLINHEVGHRLGHGHVTCDKDGDLAPVMQQQTKFLDHDGIHCLPNPWPYPSS
ncbi:DUF3152 domain-containing protein [Streptomyces sp. NBC_01275]|uniref:DUF3152 domain-containing protein n=1 Tax=Streptomyces sp. NBC_01275 TaxID=2903807 RepID=UPI002257B026|nr:DUF3152 domain-containing protein [Streptomyces sp. NBC_01275]MCX4764820.1 DUF3152 domain-containing protein [Streptomyces sp. NBC_01275]